MTTNSMREAQPPEPMMPEETPPENAESAAKPVSLEAALNTAMASGRWLVAVWYLADGQIHLYRELDAFPFCDLPSALRLLTNDFAGIGEVTPQGDHNP